MSSIDFMLFARNYKSDYFGRYGFVLFDKDTLIIVKFSPNSSSIVDIKVVDNIIPNESTKNQLMKGQKLEEVILLMGYPDKFTKTSYKSLTFRLPNNKLYEVFFDENMLVYDVKYKDLYAHEDPTRYVNENCAPREEKTISKNTILIRENMSFEEVVQLIGKPQRACGSGAICYEWDLEDNKMLKILFTVLEYGCDDLYVVRYQIR